MEESLLQRQRKDTPEAETAGLRDEALHQPTADPGSVNRFVHRERGDLGQLLAVDAQRPAADDAFLRVHRYDELPEEPRELIVGLGEHEVVTGEAVHQGFDLTHVRDPCGADRDLGRGPNDALGDGFAARTGDRAHRRRKAGAGSDLDQSVTPGLGGGDHREASRMPRPRSSSSSVIVRGGTTRTTFGPATHSSRWDCRARATTSAALPRTATPQINPAPRTATTSSFVWAMVSRRSASRAPLRRTSTRNRGSPIFRHTASAAEATSGPPPNVVA